MSWDRTKYKEAVKTLLEELKAIKIPEEKLRVAKDEEILRAIRARWRNLGRNHLVAYLCGPIDTADDFGKIWRKWITKKLAGMDILTLNPPEHEELKTGLSVEESNKVMTELIKKENWPEFRKIAGQVRYFDFKNIEDFAHFIIVYFPLGIATGGSTLEIEFSRLNKIPKFLVCYKRKLNHFSSKLVLDTVLENGKIFTGFDALLQYLKRNLEKMKQ